MQPDNLISLKDDMIAFIAGHGMRRLNAYVTEEVPTVIFKEDSWDLFRNVAIQPAHTVAGDEGHHVVFKRDKIVRLHSISIVSETPVHRTGKTGLCAWRMSCERREFRIGKVQASRIYLYQ